MSDQYFHFTIGPVQGFVAQARRTRDFWAGSFLLSWLAAVAIKSVEKQKGEVIFPTVDQNYLDWLENRGKDQPPKQGCVPNRFKGGLARVSGDFNPEQVEAAVSAAWEALAEMVWKNDLEHCSPKTRAIWERQVNHFWEISWVLTDQEEDSNLLERRKNWRSYYPPEESGVKCMMMEGWQELSGTLSPNAKALGNFWGAVRQQRGQSIKTDLRDHEYLCAIAFIKRRFAHVFKQLKAELPSGWTVYGWEVNPSVPSVAYIAAAPWLARVLELAPENKLKEFHDQALLLTKSYGEYKTNLACINDVIAQKNEKLLFWRLKSLDGNVFFESSLDNRNIYPGEQFKQAKKVKKALTSLRTSVSEALEPVSPFYAVLMMDGDSLGVHMSDIKKHARISQALELFTTAVAGIVDSYSGFLVYAGGDDVLALLPLETALPCAFSLRQQYLEAFSDSPDINSTLSGAIEYAHIKMPLGKVLGDAHRLLDQVAKEEFGRDTIAVRVWKPGGQHLQWARPWEKAIADNKLVIDELARDFQQTEQETPFSNSFFFNVEGHFSMLNGGVETASEMVFDKKTIVQLIAAEYLNSGVNVNRQPPLSLEAAIEKIQPLLDQCFEVKRDLHRSDGQHFIELGLNTHALQFIRFLALKGVR